MGKAGLITVDTLRRKRKYALIFAFVLAAFLTPPDIISQVLLALPLIGLYEVSIMLIGLTAAKNDKQSV